MAGFSLRTPVHLRSKISLNNPLRFPNRQSKGAGLGLFVVKSLLENEEIDYRFERYEDHLVFYMNLLQKPE